MKRKTRNSIAMALSVLLALMTFVPTAHAQPPEKYVWDTGVVALGGPTEVLRLTVVNFAMADGSVKFRRINYTPDCDAEGVCKLNLESTLLTSVVTLSPGQGASFTNLTPGTYVRAMVLSNTPNLRVNAEIFDSTTGQTRAIIALLLP
jgi:prepilin-type processing-associated H-X9-DG protein